MTEEEQEQKLLDQHGKIMAESLIARAQELQVDLRPLLDTGYGWFDWLITAFGEDDAKQCFWNLSEPYAIAVTNPNSDSYTYEDRKWQVASHAIHLEARRWQVASHAIHLIGAQLYPPSLIRWDEDKWLLNSTVHWERSFPIVHEINNTLITVYYIVRIDRLNDGWRGTLYAISIEHLTEFDWLEFAETHAERDQNYTLNDVLFNLILEGCGVCLWISGRGLPTLEQCQAIVRERATYFANNFAWVMMTYHANGILKLDQLRAIGTEYAWVELPEYRKTFSINRTDQAQAERHSIRVYQYGGARYTLDRCLTLDPPGYILYYQDKQHRDITPVIKVDGHELWGEGIAWSKAEALAHEAVKKRTWRNI